MNARLHERDVSIQSCEGRQHSFVFYGEAMKRFASEIAFSQRRHCHLIRVMLMTARVRRKKSVRLIH